MWGVDAEGAFVHPACPPPRVPRAAAHSLAGGISPMPAAPPPTRCKKRVTVYIDGKAIKTLVSRELDAQSGFFSTGSNAGSNAPFDQPFYVILNLAVGGSWPKPPNSTTPFPSTLSVDYVRVLGK